LAVWLLVLEMVISDSPSKKYTLPREGFPLAWIKVICRTFFGLEE
jgi:hypothetical protein